MTGQDGFAIGVDLGTSNTVAVLRWPDGRTRPLLFDGAPVMPSAVYLDDSGRLQVGRDALRLAALDPGRLELNPKRRVDESSVLLGGHEVPTVDLLGALLGAVARSAVEAVGFLPPAALTYPASWGAQRREVLAAAAVRAGWPPPRFVPEPVAAARYFADVLRRPVPVGASLAVFDFGGGTLDVAVVRNSGSGFEVLGDGGVEDLGGLDVDAELVAHLGRLLEQTSALNWAKLDRPGSLTDARNRRLFWEDVRGAKEMLSRTPIAPVAVPSMDEAVHLTREELERIAGPLVQRAVTETAAVIQRCGLRPEQLAGLFLVGGSSRLPLVARMLHSQLGIAPTVLEQPELPVAEGALAELVPPVGSAALTPGIPGQHTTLQETPTGPFAPVSGVPAAPVSGPGGYPASSPPAPGPVSGPPATWAGGPPTSTFGYPASPATPTSPSYPPGPQPTGAGYPAGPLVSAPPVSAPPGYPSSPVQPPGSGYPAPGQPGPGYPGAPLWPAGGPNGATPPPTLPAPARRPWYRRGKLLLAGGLALLLVVLAGAAGGWWLLRDKYHEVSFAAFATSGLPVPMVLGSDSPDAVMTAVHGDTAYLGYGLEDGYHVIVHGLGGGSDRQVTVKAGGTSVVWKHLIALDGVVLLHAYEYGVDVPDHIFGLDPKTGAQRWDLRLDSYEEIMAVGSKLIKEDTAGGRLVLIDEKTGKESASLPDPRSSDGSRAQTTYLFPVFAAADTESASLPTNDLLWITSGKYVVQVAADESARVINVEDFGHPASKNKIALYNAFVLGVGDRLFVATNESGYGLMSYRLSDLGDPKVLYTAPDDVRPIAMRPCGTGVCVLEKGTSDPVVRAFDVSKQRWDAKVPGGESLLSVGDGVLVGTSDNGARYLDGSGKERLGDKGNGLLPVRVNGGSVLLFGSALNPYPQDLAVSGFGTRSGTVTPLGQLQGVRGNACSWSSTVIVCPREKDFQAWTFAK